MADLTVSEIGSVLIPKLPMRFIPAIPLPQQSAFLLYNGIEALYGGAARGGKSVALLMAGSQYVEIPGYNALLIRRTLPDLRQPGGLLDMAFEWFSNTGARWIDIDKIWKFPSGATIRFGYLESEKDKLHYQGGAYQFIGFDELTQFTESQYTYLFSRLVKLAGVDIPLRMRSATNPPSDEAGEWVKRRFITHPDIDDDGNKMDEPRVFIKSFLRDNYHVDQKSYLASLSRLDPVTRAKLKDGNWDAERIGDRFKREWFPITYVVPPPGRAARGWDFAATENGGDFTAGVRIQRRPSSGIYVITNATWGQLSAANVENLVKETASSDGHLTKIFLPQDPGQAGKAQIEDYKRNKLPDYMVEGIRETRDKVSHSTLTSAYAEQMKFELLCGPWNQKFIDHLCVFPFGPHDDIADAFFTAFDGLLSMKDAEWDVV